MADRFRSNRHAAPSFNGRTADSGSAYRGSNPWGAAKTFELVLSVISHVAEAYEIRAGSLVRLKSAGLRDDAPTGKCGVVITI